MREDSGTQGSEPVTAATQRGWNVGGTIPTETNEIVRAEAEGCRRVGAAVSPISIAHMLSPIRHPFVQIPHHVERAPTRLAVRARPRAHGTGGVYVAVRRPIVRTGIRCARRGVLPLQVR